MRRRLALIPAVGALAAPLLLTACAGGDDGVPVKVTGEFGKQPDVRIPKGKPGTSFEVATLSKGKGAAVRRGDLVVANYVSYRWNDTGSKLFASSFAAGQPGAFPSGNLVPGLDRALTGKKVGSRLVTVIPPKDGYGAAGAPSLQIGAADSLVYVLDVVATYPGGASAQGAQQPLNDPKLPAVTPPAAGSPPQITVPKAAPPSALQVRTLVKGGGEPVRKGQLIAIQFTGSIWRDGKVFDSSWSAGRPFSTVIGVGQVVKGWDDGLVGQRIGSRMLLVVPPKWGYGAKGLQQSGIKGNDTLIFVVDLLGAH